MNAVELDDEPLKAASSYVFYNISKWTLKTLHAAATNTIISLELVPHPNLKHQEAIALDYAMTDGLKTIQVRAAMAGYLLRLWNVNCSADHHLTGAEYQLWLRNSECLAVAHNARLAPGMS